MKILFLAVLLTLTSVWLPAQEEERLRQRKPVLIRDDRTEAPDREEVFVHDPDKAQENVEIGDFYYKRDNYKAAENRYRDAVKYNLRWPESYEKLIQALEKQAKFQDALAIANQFLDMNPKAGEASHFQRKKAELERKIQP